MNRFQTAFVACWLIVMPKVRRVRSGEAVVVSHLLRQTNAMSNTSDGTSEHGNDRRISGLYPPPATVKTRRDSNIPNKSVSFATNVPEAGRKKIVVTEKDPIPKAVETELLQMEKVIRDVKGKW